MPGLFHETTYLHVNHIFHSQKYSLWSVEVVVFVHNNLFFSRKNTSGKPKPASSLWGPICHHSAICGFVKTHEIWFAKKYCWHQQWLFAFWFCQIEDTQSLHLHQNSVHKNMTDESLFVWDYNSNTVAVLSPCIVRNIMCGRELKKPPRSLTHVV